MGRTHTASCSRERTHPGRKTYHRRSCTRSSARGDSRSNTVIEKLVQSPGAGGGGEANHTGGGRMIESIPTCKWLRTKSAFVTYRKPVPWGARYASTPGF